MEKELNIAAILKEKPKGTKLWSPISGDCKYEYLIHNSINVWFQGLGVVRLSKKGKWSPYGETIIFPSKQMQDWSKFAWKKGDVLTDEERFVVFKGFNTDDYTEFSASFEYKDGTYRQNLWFVSNDFRKVSDNIAQEIIKKVEEHYGGKLNLETLEIEQPKQEFKDGDIVFAKCKDKGTNYLIIYKSITNNRLNDYCSLNMDSNYLDCTGAYYLDFEFYSLHSATNLGMQQLFSALEKKNKRWNPDTKQIEDLPKKYELKPFDKVLVKIAGHTWTADFFSHYDENDEELPYVCIGYGRVTHCIPYNEETKHLLGTTDEWKG